jgi:uncharacterized protein YfaS (alpha-2-macroglobulin family)
MDYVRAGVNPPRDKPGLRSLATIPARTDGSGASVIKLPALPVGEYQLDWEGPEAKVLEKTTFFVGEPATLFGHTGLEVFVDRAFVKDGQFDEMRKASCAPGSTIRVLLLAPEGGSHAMVSLHDWKLREARLVKLDGPVTRVDLLVPDDVLAEVQITAAGFVNGTSFRGNASVAVDHDVKALTVDVTAAVSTATPRQQQTVTVRVLNPEGAPEADTPVLLSVFDESLMAFVPPYEPSDFTPEALLEGTSFSWSVVSLSDDVWLNERLDLAVDSYGESFSLLPFEVPAEPPGYCGLTVGSRLGGRELLTTLGKATAPPSFPVSPPNGDHSFPQQGQFRAVTLRKDFLRSAFWSDMLMTDADGNATVSFNVPDNLTAWRVEAYAIGRGPKLGGGRGGFRASVPVAGRLHLPRFLVAGDEAELSVTARNNTDKDLLIETGIDAPAPLDGSAEPQRQNVAAGAEVLSGWRFSATAPGTSLITARASSEMYSDGMVLPLEVIEHGFAQQLTRGGTLSGSKATVELRLPKARRPGSASLTVDVEAGLAPAMLRALPYLVQYPYDCTEQATSRLLASTLLIRHLLDEGVDEATLLQVAGFADAEAYAAFRRERMEAIEARYEEDSGYWGWFSNVHADDYMTAYALWGQLLLTKSGEAAMERYDLSRAIGYLDRRLGAYGKFPDFQAWLLFVLSQRKYLPETEEGITGVESTVFEELITKPELLSPSGLAWLAMAAAEWERQDNAQALLDRLVKMVTTAREPGSGTETAHWAAAGPSSTTGTTTLSKQAPGP